MREVDQYQGEQPIRAFVAIELPEVIREGLARWQERLRSLPDPGARWVDPQGIHLTLKFLGNVPPPLMPQIETALIQGVHGMSPFCLEVAELGVFPNWQRPRVIWVSIGGEKERLAEVQRRLEKALLPLGFPLEPRPFSPHLTLARLRPGAATAELRRFGERMRTMAGEAIPSSWEVRAISLMQSQLTPKGAIYHRLALFPLGNALSMGPL